MNQTLKFYGLILFFFLHNLPALKAQRDLLSESELLKKPIYNNLNQAFREYDKVYRIRLKGSGDFYGQITAVHPKIDSLHNLQDFQVTHEALDNLPPSFGGLKKLQFLYLSGNKFTMIPDTVYSLKHLKRLDIQKNQLRSISAKIAQLQELEFLYLHDNPGLENIPLESLSKLKKLKFLNVHNTKIPREQLEKLQQLLPDTQIEF
ncbi:MAG: hypothetical protein NW226_15860 [Microscillaceae bacterium]|nr:hypothetical protein [Microscillaceae bacterium]